MTARQGGAKAHPYRAMEEGEARRRGKLAATQEKEPAGSRRYEMGTGLKTRHYKAIQDSEDGHGKPCPYKEVAG
jgi:hypothetical protein